MVLDYGTSNVISVKLEGPFAGGAGAGAKLTQVQLPAAGWKNAESPYFQNVLIEGISNSSMVNIQADRELIARLGENGTAIHIDNDGGVTTAYAIGSKPPIDLTLQVSLLEVVQV